MTEYNLFSLLKRKNTGVLHLFHSKLNGDACNVEPHKLSICQRMSLDESEATIFRCENENEARRRCAEIGREVCGTCVSNLYADNDD